MGSSLIQTRETTKGTWKDLKDLLKKEQTLLYQGDTFELDSKRYIFDQDTKPYLFTIVKFLYSTTAKTVNARKNWYVTSKLYKKI